MWKAKDVLTGKDRLVCVKADIDHLPWEYVRIVALMGFNVSH